MWKCAIALLLGAVTCGCSQRRQMTAENVRSQLTSAISFAATAELSIERAASGATTPSFDSGHVEYLRKQIEDSLRELSDKQPESDAQAAAAQCRDALLSLRNELLHLAPNDRVATAQAKARIHDIRESLQRARASL